MNVKQKLLLLFLFSLCNSIESKVIPYFVYNGMKTILQTVFGPTAQKAAFKTNEFIEKRSGVDMSLGDLSGMNVEMVKVLEPFDKYVVVSKYVNNRLNYVIEMLAGLFTPKKVSQKDFNELIGLTIVLNETETAAAEVLMSTPQCLLSQDDYYFKRSIDPCRELSKESFATVIGRIEKVQKTIKSMGAYVQVPGAWENHLRYVVMKLDLYSADVLDAKQLLKWATIKEYVHNKQVL